MTVRPSPPTPQYRSKMVSVAAGASAVATSAYSCAATARFTCRNARALTRTRTPLFPVAAALGTSAACSFAATPKLLGSAAFSSEGTCGRIPKSSQRNGSPSRTWSEAKAPSSASASSPSAKEESEAVAPGNALVGSCKSAFPRWLLRCNTTLCTSGCACVTRLKSVFSCTSATGSALTRLICTAPLATSRSSM